MGHFFKMQFGYRGRLAPSPTGFLHVGHALTFWTAQERARLAGGTLVLRNENLDPNRSRPEFVNAMLEDLQWFGFRWQEGPDCGGPFGPYSQSERLDYYRECFEQLKLTGLAYPCQCSRQDVLRALQAPHAADDEPIYPGTCRSSNSTITHSPLNWRFRVPDGEPVEFEDGLLGPQRFIAGKDFGDFVLWRHDGVPAYQFAVVADDNAMHITEVVRGADLLLSTARQILLYRALRWSIPTFYHCPLITNPQGQRLAKREAALSLRHLREKGLTPDEIRKSYGSLSSP